MAKRIPSILRRARVAGPSPERRSAGFGATGGAWGGPVMGMSSFLPSPVMSGVAVTPELSLAFAPVFAAIGVISTDVAVLPLRAMRRSREGGRRPATAHPAFDLVYCEPNRNTSSMRFRQSQTGHALGWGNGFAEIVRDGVGYPRELHLLSPKPTDTWPERTRDGRIFYNVDGGRRTLLGEDVLHVAGLGWDGLSGYSPIALQRQAVGLGIAQEQFGASFYGNGSTPRGALKVKKRLNPEGIRNLRESFEAVHQGTVNANRLAILEEGTEWENISINPVDAQYLESRKFQVVEIARIYRVPPHKIGDYSQAHLANLEASNLDYLNTTLIQWITCWEQELDRKLLTRRERAHGLHFAHDLTALLRGDMKSRAEYYRARFDVGSLSPDEIRDREGDNPLEGGAGRATYVQLNLAKLGPGGSPVAPPRPGPEAPEGEP